MSVTINGDTGIDKVQDGSIVQADLASGITVDSLSTAPGSAPSYSARAWVNFNGTGTVAINSSGNVSSITDNGVGVYTLNFATTMQDVNYSYSGSAADFTDGGLSDLMRVVTYSGTSTNKTTSTLKIHTNYVDQQTIDCEDVNIVVFR